MRKNSIKNTRINGEVQKELSILINRELKDPRISTMTSVVAVEVAPDLKHAKVYISVLGDQEKVQSTYEGLRSASSFLRSQLAKTVNLRNTPELTFIMDQSIEYGVEMSKKIDEINRKSNQAQADVETIDDAYEDGEEEAEEEAFEDAEEDNE